MLVPMADPWDFIRNPDFLRRAGVTLAAVAVYRIGSWVPLPGVDISLLLTPETVHNTAIPRLSIVALGVVPFLSALILVEVAMIAVPPLRAWSTARAERRAQIDGWVFVVALAIAAYQANSIAVALEAIRGLVSSPGLAFRAGVVTSLVAGSAFLLWLASLITRRGIGSGFWVLVAVPYIVSFSEALLVQASLWGPAGVVTIALTLGFLALSTALLAALLKTRPPLASADELPWAPILGFAAANWLLVVPVLALWLLGADIGGLGVTGLLQSQAAILLPVLTVPLIVALRRRSFGAPASVAAATPLALAFAVLVGAATALAVLPAQPLFPGPAILVTLAALGLVIVESACGAQPGTATQPVSS